MCRLSVDNASPQISNEELQGVVEFAFLEDRIPKLTIQFLLELGEIIARTYKNLKMNYQPQALEQKSTPVAQFPQERSQSKNNYSIFNYHNRSHPTT